VLALLASLPCFPTQQRSCMCRQLRIAQNTTMCVCVLQSCHAAAVVQEWAAVDFLRGEGFDFSCGLGTVQHPLRLRELSPGSLEATVGSALPSHHAAAVAAATGVA
jgi:hypothetical protein